MNYRVKPTLGHAVSVLATITGFALLVLHPAVHGILFYASVLTALGLVSVIAAAYVSRRVSRTTVLDGLVVTSITVIVATPLLAALHAWGRALLWEQPVAATLSPGPVAYVILLGLVLVIAVPISLMFALGTAASLRERVGVCLLLGLTFFLAISPAIATSGFETASVLEGGVGVIAAVLIGAPLFLYGRTVSRKSTLPAQ